MVILLKFLAKIKVFKRKSGLRFPKVSYGKSGKSVSACNEYDKDEAL